MKANSPYPSLVWRLYSVWYRHMRVYSKNLISNGFPTFLEPLLFLAGIGLGLGRYVTDSMEGLKYMEFLGTGLLVTASMYTAAFECTFGTFIRLEFEKVYDGMLAAPITASNLILGEVLWVGTKGLFFSFSVLCVLAAFGVVPFFHSLPVVLVGFATGVMFGVLALVVTSFVKTINHFNFFLTGVLSPMFFLCGVVFPINDLPKAIRPVAELMPLTHVVRWVRAICASHVRAGLAWDLLYIVVFTVVVGWFAVNRLRKRLVS
jgi:lipooligosaccharide transport system permease protein